MSLAILSTLVVIGAGVGLTQLRYNPAVLPKDALSPTPAKKKTFPLSSTKESIIPLPQGLLPLTAPEMFEAHNLSNKINGKAELYLSAGFVSLTSQRLKDERASDFWMEAYVYDMGTGQNSFSVFSAQRRDDGQPLNLTQYSYRTENAFFLVHGRYYVELIASEASERILTPMNLLATAFIRNTTAETATIDEIKLFPQQNLVAGSISLISSDAFGYKDFDNVYTAEYEQDKNSLMAYISRRRTPDEAGKLALAYQNFLAAFGGKKIVTSLPFENARMIEILDTYEIIFAYGPLLVGVREADTKEQAKNLAKRLYNHLTEVAGDS
ncbi:MAG: hypothetical protein HKO68_12205 [Desulfobacterales bacterium]|nr:hypothetical protein [Desulfobacterales bacterium]